MSLWQTQSWQEMLQKSGQTQEYFQLEMNYNSQDKREVFIEKRRVALGEYALFVIGYEGEIDERLEDNLEKLCEEESCLFAQIETLDYSGVVSPSSGDEGFKDPAGQEIPAFTGMTRRKYYKKFIPPYTVVIDLNKTEDEILAAMKPKGRYNIRLASKKGVEVQKVSATQENIEQFYYLMRETTARDSFAGNTLSYYQDFLFQEGSELYFATHKGELLAAGIFLRSGGVMYYYYGASSNHKRNLMAPYALQWQAIVDAKQAGCKLYDFLGVAGPDEADSSLAGVTDFKLRLSPDRREVSEAYLFIHKKWKYKVIEFLKKIKK